MSTIHPTLYSPISEFCNKSRINLEHSLRRKGFCSYKREIRVIELFAGVGGFRIGLEEASPKFKTVWNNQWEPSTLKQDASICYCAYFGKKGHSNKDIGTVPVEDIPNADLLCGGFPCQDYSVANSLQKAGGIEGKKGVLWWQIHRILRDHPNPPKYVFLENVDRLIKSPVKQRGRDFAIILASLSDLGYVAEWRILNAAEYGMPQRRRRTYIVAYKQGTDLFNRCTETNGFEWLSSNGIIANAFKCEPSAKKPGKMEFDIEGNLIDITNNFNKDKNDSPFANAGVMFNRHVCTMEVSPLYDGPRLNLGDILVQEDEVPEEFFISDKDLSKWQYYKGSKSETRKSSDGYEYNYSEGAMSFPDSIDGPSRTIITSEGGTAPSRFKHVVATPSGRLRRLIPKELERLNMFPDDITSKSNDARRAFLMGNALVTGVIERIGISLLYNIK